MVNVMKPILIALLSISGGTSTLSRTTNLKAYDFLKACPRCCKYGDSSLSLSNREVIRGSLTDLVVLRGGAQVDDFMNVFGEDTVESGKSDEDDEWVCRRKRICMRYPGVIPI